MTAEMIIFVACAINTVACTIAYRDARKRADALFDEHMANARRAWTEDNG